MADFVGGTVKYVIEVDDKDTSKIDSADAKFKNVGDTVVATDKKATGSFGNIVKGALAFTGVATVFDTVKNATVGAVQSFGDVESQLNVLGALTGATTSQLDQLRKTSVDLGNDISLPGVSAADAAKAMVELGKQGIAVNDILGASKSVLQLAKIGNIEFADSALIVASALKTFGLAGSEGVKVADLFAAASSSSGSSVDLLGQALQQTGAVAAGLKVPLNDTVTALAELANQGIRGSDAGTSLKTFLQRLIPQSQEAADTMKKLGISVFDANGQFIGIQGAIKSFADGTKNLSDEQRQAAFQTIFGTDAIRAANVLVGQGEAGFTKMAAAVNAQGKASSITAAQNKGIKGTIDALKSSFDTALLSVGGFVSKGLKPILDFAGANPVPVFVGLATAFIGVGIAAGVVAINAFAAAAGLTAVQLVLDALGIGLIIAAVAALAAGLVVLEQKTGAISKVFGTLADVFGSIIKALSPVVTFIKESLVGAFNALKKVLEPIITFIGTTLVGIFNQLKTIAGQLYDALKPLFDPIIDFVQKHQATILAVLKAIGIALGVLVAAPIIAGLLILAAALKVIEIVLKGLSLIISGVVAVVQFLAGIFSAIFNAIAVVVTTVFNAIAAVWNAVLKPVFTAIIYIVTALFTVIFTIFNAIFQIIYTIVSTIAQIIFAIFQGIYNFIAGIVTGIYNTVAPIFQAIYDFIAGIVTGIYNTVVEIFNSIYNFIAGIVNGVYNAVSNGFNNVKNAISNAIKGAVDAVGNFVNSFIEKGKNIIDGIVQGISNGADAVVNKIKEICSGALDAVKKFFGIGSPSKVMAEQGKFLMQGFARGITAASSDVMAAVASVNGDLLNSFTGTGSGTLVPVGGTIDGSSGSSSGSQTVIFKADLNGIMTESRQGTRQVAKSLIESVNEELRSRGVEEIGGGNLSAVSNV